VVGLGDSQRRPPRLLHRQRPELRPRVGGSRIPGRGRSTLWPVDSADVSAGNRGSGRLRHRFREYLGHTCDFTVATTRSRFGQTGPRVGSPAKGPRLGLVRSERGRLDAVPREVTPIHEYMPEYVTSEGFRERRMAFIERRKIDPSKNLPYAKIPIR